MVTVIGMQGVKHVAWVNELQDELVALAERKLTEKGVGIEQQNVLAVVTIMIAAGVAFGAKHRAPACCVVGAVADFTAQLFKALRDKPSCASGGQKHLS